ncbi:chitin synthase-domain-containing protein [Cladochytrium replicatum]|nr:chitin synthase-domain-containing protein [Cladochytrium replicatum]
MLLGKNLSMKILLADVMRSKIAPSYSAQSRMQLRSRTNLPRRVSPTGKFDQALQGNIHSGKHPRPSPWFVAEVINKIEEDPGAEKYGKPRHATATFQRTAIRTASPTSMIRIAPTYPEAPYKTHPAYQVIVGAILGLGAIEYLLYIGGFVYCLFHCYAGHNWKGKILSMIMMPLFIGLRCVVLPLVIVNLPIPYSGSVLPQDLTDWSLWVTGGIYMALIVLPVLASIVTMIRGTTRVGNKLVFNPDAAPMVVGIVPVYNELPVLLLAAIRTFAASKYPKTRLHLIVAFDDDRETPLYLETIKSLDPNIVAHYSLKGEGVPTYPPELEFNVDNVRITVCRFPHGGKRLTQSQAFVVLEKHYFGPYPTTAEIIPPNNLMVLFIDSDIVLDELAVANFVEDMVVHGETRIAVTGLINCSSQSFNFWLLLQDIEYVHGQMMDRVLESWFGAVTCLPGALTMVRYNELKKVAKDYFGQHLPKQMDVFDYSRFHLGEDRYLTHLFMENGTLGVYCIGFVETAYCKTDAPRSLNILLKQRRRWFLGAFANEVMMLTSPTLWRKYPILLLIRFFTDSIKSVSLLIYVILLTAILDSVNARQPAIVPILFFAIPLVLNWMCMIYFGFRLHRFKAAMYPIMHFVYPILTWCFHMYAMFTCAKRTWGGPRTAGSEVQEAALMREGVGVDGGVAVNDIIAMYSEEYSKDIFIPRAAANPQEIQRLQSQLGPSEIEYSQIAMNIIGAYADGLDSFVIPDIPASATQAHPPSSVPNMRMARISIVSALTRKPTSRAGTPLGKFPDRRSFRSVKDKNEEGVIFVDGPIKTNGMQENQPMGISTAVTPRHHAPQVGGHLSTSNEGLSPRRHRMRENDDDEVEADYTSEFLQQFVQRNYGGDDNRNSLFSESSLGTTSETFTIHTSMLGRTAHTDSYVSPTPDTTTIPRYDFADVQAEYAANAGNQNSGRSSRSPPKVTIQTGRANAVIPEDE